MMMRIYVSGSQYLATEVDEEEAQRIMSAFDNRETDRITVKQDGDAMGQANILCAINGALGRDWLDGTDYTYDENEEFYCIRIPYAKITGDNVEADAAE